MSIAHTISLPQIPVKVPSHSAASQSSFWKKFRGQVWAFLVDIGRRRGEHALKHGHY